MSKPKIAGWSPTGVLDVSTRSAAAAVERRGYHGFIRNWSLVFPTCWLSRVQRTRTLAERPALPRPHPLPPRHRQRATSSHQPGWTALVPFGTGPAFARNFQAVLGCAPHEDKRLPFSGTYDQAAANRRRLLQHLASLRRGWAENPPGFAGELA